MTKASFILTQIATGLLMAGCALPVPSPQAPPPFDAATPDLSATVKFLRDADFLAAFEACQARAAVKLAVPMDRVTGFTCFAEKDHRPLYIAIRQSNCSDADEMQTPWCWEFANINPEYGRLGYLDGANPLYGASKWAKD